MFIYLLYVYLCYYIINSSNYLNKPIYFVIILYVLFGKQQNFYTCIDVQTKDRSYW